MKQLIEMYNQAAAQFGDWIFKNFIPPFFKLIEIVLRLTLIYSFYLLVTNGLSEVF